MDPEVRPMGSVKGTQPEPEPVETPADGSSPEISERVLAYFRRNSEAMDSVEGIARFWVREDRSVVERALADLHRKGLLDRRLIGGSALHSPPGESSAARADARGGPPTAPPSGP